MTRQVFERYTLQHGAYTLGGPDLGSELRIEQHGDTTSREAFEVGAPPENQRDGPGPGPGGTETLLVFVSDKIKMNFNLVASLLRT